jgi:hypothetical protein
MTEPLPAGLRLRKRAAIILLALAPGLLYFAWFGPKPARDHAVVFQFDRPLDDVRRLTATWSDPRDGSALAGSKFDIGPTSSQQFRSNVRVPDGEFWVQLEIEQASGSKTIRRKVTLGDGETKIYLTTGP